MSQLESYQKPHPKSLECFRSYLYRYHDYLKKSDIEFLPDEEYLMWLNVEGLDDFIAIRSPLARRDTSQDTLAPAFAAILQWIRNQVAPCLCISEYIELTFTSSLRSPTNRRR